MKTKLFAFSLAVVILSACHFSASSYKDLSTGLSATGDGLSCDKVYLSNGNQTINRNSFVYGETFYIKFENVEGFNETNGFKFPGLKMLVISQAGDTVMNYKDLYAQYTEGVNLSPLLAQSKLTLATPVHSGQEYKLYIKIWDKKGEGTLEARMDFNVVPNQAIKIQSSKEVSYDEIYMFSKNRMAMITDNNAQLNEDVYIVFEGLDGFKSEAGKVYAGLSIKAEDAEGKLILNEPDLIGETPMELSTLKAQVAPNINIKNPNVKNPVTCLVEIWDKKSDRSIKTSVQLNVK